MNRRTLMRMMGGIAAAAAAQQPGPEFIPLSDWYEFKPREAPNILFILTDDHKQDAMGAYGDKLVRTPNLDRLAREGVLFREAFCANPVCAPSRASILTGQYSNAHGVISNADGPEFRNQPGIADRTIFPHLLKQAGYHTAVIGKWHLRSWPHGFDHWAIFPGQGSYIDPEIVAGGTRVKTRGHSDDVVADQALLYLKNRPKDVPFCLLCQFKGPHSNWTPAPRFEKEFSDVEFPLPATFDDDLKGRSNATRSIRMAIETMVEFDRRDVPPGLTGAARKRAVYQSYMRWYYRTILGVDENIGRVLDYLDQNGLTENTVVVYTSDNGLFTGEHGWRDKRIPYEAAARVPMIVRWPRRIQPRVDNSHLVVNVDIAPTLLGLAGIPAPAWMHGLSWEPLLAGRTDYPWRDAVYIEYTEYPTHHCVRKIRALRTARWKLLHFWESPEEWELFDLQTDPNETRNLAADPRHRSVMADLKAKLESIRRYGGERDYPGRIQPAAVCKDLKGI